MLFSKGATYMLATFVTAKTQYGLQLMALAVVICGAGSWSSMRLLDQVLPAHGTPRAAWIFLSSLVLGTTAWTAFHIATPAYLPHVDSARAIVALVMCIGGACLALTVATARGKRIDAAVGGSLLGLTMVAVRLITLPGPVGGEPSIWHFGAVGLAIFPGVIASAVALTAARGGLGDHAKRHALWLLALAIVSTHLAMMAAVGIKPTVFAVAEVPDRSLVRALGASLIFALIIASGCCAYLIGVRARREVKERVAALASTDVLTGLATRAALEIELRRRAQTGAVAQRFGIFLVEIADIDAINQQFGLRIGDLLIVSVARRLIAACTRDVFLARSGDAQFCGVVTHGGSGRARAMHAALSREFLIEGHSISIDVRFGTAMSAGAVGEPELVLLHAQTALRRAIADPLDTIVMHDGEIDAAAQRRIALANALRGALERDEFELNFQPQVWIADRHVLGYEALLRWRHPTLGMISPTEFIPIAEKTGAILAIGAWALREACRTAAQWPSNWRVAVNLSPLQLRQADLPARVSEALADSGLAAQRLEIEITESLFIDDRAHGLDALRRVKALGVRVSLDDFGTGYSSMELLRRFPFDKVKLDKSFVDDLETDQRALAILHAMLALGNELCIPILVEGVESERQLAMVRQAGCNKVQGFLTGQPVPASVIADAMIHRLSA